MKLVPFVLAVMLLFAAQTSSARTLTYDRQSVLVDGKRTYLVSGEFHYFRVPKAEWRRRLELLKAAGGNCVATYVPWVLHEPEEGKILFGDRPDRDLDGFLKTVEEAGLMAIVRPGPYQYSELLFDGLPRWLVEGYPEIATKKADGKPLRLGSVDYNHPTFLAKTRRYFKAAADVIRPHMAANGGCVVMVQLDNELTGIHVWFGMPKTRAYFDQCADYLATLRDCLAEDGLSGPYCHNAGGPAMMTSYAPCVDRLGTKDFLLGYDNYYALQQGDRASPCPSYFFAALLSCDILRAYGYPPVGFEIQCGTIGDIPPILKEDILACHMCNLAAGMKGVNYYVFTGGPNPAGLGNTVDVYDYGAPVAADGSLRPTYESVKAFGEFVHTHPQLLEADRLAAVRLGFEWPNHAGCAPMDGGFLRQGMLYSLMQSPYHPEHVLLDRGDIDLTKPLVLAGVKSMSADVQRKVAAFVDRGGSLLVAPDFPRVDLEGKPCAVLADAVKAPETEPAGVDMLSEPLCLAGPLRVYGLKVEGKFKSIPSGAKAVVTSADGSRAYGCSWTHGAGKVTRLALTWKALYFLQSDMIAALVADLGAKPVVTSSNRSVFTTAYALKNGKTGVFALNLRSSPQKTTVTSPTGTAIDFNLTAMQVGYGEF